MADENTVIGIQFGVEGGTSIDRDSGYRIKTQLEAIANQIALEVKVNAKMAAHNNAVVTRGVKEQEVGYESLRKTLENLYKTKARLLKTPTTDEGKQATVNGEILERHQKELEESYNTQLAQLRAIGDADAEQVAEIQKQIQLAEELRTALEAAYQSQKDDLNAPKEEQVTYEDLRKTLEEIYKAKSRLLKIPIDAAGNPGNVSGELLMRQQQELEQKYQEQLEKLKAIGEADATRSDEIKEQIRLLEEEKTALDAAYQAQQKQIASASAPKMATPTDLAKLGLKAQSLYTDNGFDKIIARSKEAKQIVDEYYASVKAVLQNPSSVTKDQVAALNAEFLRTETRLKELGDQTNTIGNKLKEAFGSRVIQNLASKAWLLILTYLKQIYRNVVEIDKAMTELQIVTRATSEQLAAAAKDIANSAQSIGASMADLIRSTTVYARLGYTLDQARSLAENTTKYANVTGVNVDEATTNITGALKAYNLSVDDLEKTLDKFIWVGNKFAISQAEIGEAMNNAAATLRAGGNSIDEAMAILAAANASVQNISRSSTGVRTLVARIAGSEADLIELGEDAGDIITTAELDKKMRAFGVAIVDANGELRSTYDILNDLANVWDERTLLEQQAIGEMFAGKRQRDVFNSIMNNWRDAQAVMDGVSGATGSLAEAQGVYLDSIEGKLQQLKATWESFSTNLLGSDIVKFFVDVLTVIAKVLNAIMDFAGKPIGQIAITVGALMALVKVFDKLRDKIGDAIIKNIDFSNGLDGTGKAALTAGQKIKNFATGIGGLVAAFAVFTVVSSLLNKFGGTASDVSKIVIGALAAITAAIMAFNTTNPLGWIALAISAVTMAIQGIESLIHAQSFEGLKEAAQETRDKWKETRDELTEVTDQLDEIQKRIDELKKKGNKISLVDSKELAALDAQQKKLLADQATAQHQEEEARKQAAADAAAAIAKYNNQHTVSDAPWWEWLLIGPWAFIHQGIAWGSDTQQEKFDKILSSAEAYREASEEDRAFIEQTLKEYDELLGDFNFGDNAELDPYLAQYTSLKDRYNLVHGDAGIVWQRVLSDPRFEGEVEALKKLANDQNVSIETILQNAPNFLAYLKEIGMYVEDDANSASGLVEQIKELRDRLGTRERIKFTDDLEMMQDKLEALHNALSDIEETGVVSMDNIGKILDADAEGYPELLSKYFKFVEGIGYQLQDEWASKSMSQVLAAMARDEIQNYANAWKDAQAELEQRPEGHEDHEVAVSNEAAAYDDLISKMTEWATLLRDPALEEATDAAEKRKQAIEDQLDLYKELIDARKDLLETYQEEISYQKELARKQKAVADLQTQVALASLDQSAAGQARLRELQEQLSSTQDELDDYTLDKAIKDLTQQLDDDYDEYKRFIDEQVNIIVEEIESLKKTFKIGFTIDQETGEVTVEEHHSGGFVGNISALKSNEAFAKLLKGEFVSTPKQMDEFMRKTLPAMVMRESGGGATINNNSPLVEINCGSVDDDTLPKLKDLVNQAVKQIEHNMESALHRTGFKKQF